MRDVHVGLICLQPDPGTRLGPGGPTSHFITQKILSDGSDKVNGSPLTAVRRRDPLGNVNFPGMRVAKPRVPSRQREFPMVGEGFDPRSGPFIMGTSVII